jgi:hypothetical protein
MTSPPASLPKIIARASQIPRATEYADCEDRGGHGGRCRGGVGEGCEEEGHLNGNIDALGSESSEEAECYVQQED